MGISSPNVVQSKVSEWEKGMQLGAMIQQGMTSAAQLYQQKTRDYGQTLSRLIATAAENPQIFDASRALFTKELKRFGMKEEDAAAMLKSVSEQTTLTPEDIAKKTFEDMTSAVLTGQLPPQQQGGAAPTPTETGVTPQQQGDQTQPKVGTPPGPSQATPKPQTTTTTSSPQQTQGVAVPSIGATPPLSEIGEVVPGQRDPLSQRTQEAETSKAKAKLIADIPSSDLPLPSLPPTVQTNKDGSFNVVLKDEGEVRKNEYYKKVSTNPEYLGPYFESSELLINEAPSGTGRMLAEIFGAGPLPESWTDEFPRADPAKYSTSVETYKKNRSKLQALKDSYIKNTPGIWSFVGDKENIRGLATFCRTPEGNTYVELKTKPEYGKGGEKFYKSTIWESIRSAHNTAWGTNIKSNERKMHNLYDAVVEDNYNKKQLSIITGKDYSKESKQTLKKDMAQYGTSFPLHIPDMRVPEENTRINLTPEKRDIVKKEEKKLEEINKVVDEEIERDGEISYETSKKLQKITGTYNQRLSAIGALATQDTKHLQSFLHIVGGGNPNETPTPETTKKGMMDMLDSLFDSPTRIARMRDVQLEMLASDRQQVNIALEKFLHEKGMDEKEFELKLKEYGLDVYKAGIPLTLATINNAAQMETVQYSQDMKTLNNALGEMAKKEAELTGPGGGSPNPKQIFELRAKDRTYRNNYDTMVNMTAKMSGLPVRVVKRFADFGFGGTYEFTEKALPTESQVQGQIVMLEKQMQYLDPTSDEYQVRAAQIEEYRKALQTGLPTGTEKLTTQKTETVTEQQPPQFTQYPKPKAMLEAEMKAAEEREKRKKKYEQVRTQGTDAEKLKAFLSDAPTNLKNEYYNLVRGGNYTAATKIITNFLSGIIESQSTQGMTTGETQDGYDISKFLNY